MIALQDRLDRLRGPQRPDHEAELGREQHPPLATTLPVPPASDVPPSTTAAIEGSR
ncbi:MAG: hypothetical protein U0869_06180 [Chloroflexota bacterium]